MLHTIINLFISGFVYPGILWNQLLIGIGLAIAFGAIWYAAYWTPILGKPRPWAVLAGSAFLTWFSIAFIQLPLQTLTSRALNFFWSQDVLARWLLLVGVPLMLYSGLVQEGSKLVPVVIYWWRKGKKIDPRLGLVIGAVSGLGFGIFEAVWVHNSVFISGWSLDVVKAAGLFWGLIPFLERFFVVSFHIATGAIAGWGLAKGKGWQFYLIVSFAHAFVNYSTIAYSAGFLSELGLEIFIIICSLIATAVALWLRYRKQKAVA